MARNGIKAFFAMLRMPQGQDVEAEIYEDPYVRKFKRLGVFGWVIHPVTKKRISASRAWELEEAPSFEQQCDLLLDEIEAKLKEPDVNTQSS